MPSAALRWEVVAALLTIVGSGVLEYYFDFFEAFAAVTRAHEALELDVLLVLTVVATVVFAAFAIRRSRTLATEVSRRHASEARFAALFSASPYPIGVFSLDDGAVIDANVMALRAAGASRDDVIGRSMRDLPYWDSATADELLRRVREQRLVRNMEVVTRRGAGDARPVLVSAQALELDGKPCFVAAMNDITEQRVAERARDAADAEFAGVFLAMRDVVMVLGRDGEYLKVPATNADGLYRPAKDLVGKHVQDILPPVEADAVRAVIRQSLDSGSAVTTEYTLHFPDRDISFSAVVTPLDDNSVVWVARDVSEELQAREALSQSEAQYRLLFDRHPQPMFVIDHEDYHYLDVNDAAIRHYGYSREEFLGMKATDMRPPEDVAHFHASVAGEWPLGEQRMSRHRKRNGEVIDVEISRDVIAYHGRQARLVLATDVTERERALAQRKMLSDRFQSAFGDAPIGMVIMSADGPWIQVNTAMCQLLGRECESLTGEPSDAITHPDDRERTRAEFAKLRLGQERAVRFEKRYVHSSGRIVWTLVSATMLGGVEGSRLIVGHVVDITERRVAEEALRQQALAFETMTEVVLVCDVEGRIMDVNPAAKTIFGYERHELIGERPSRWMKPDVGDTIFATIGRALRTNGVWTGEYEFVAKDGRTGVVETTITVLRDADGNTANAIGVIRDVTERRQMQLQLLQSQKLEAIGSLAGGIAHEINTPMQYVGDNVRFLGDGIGALGGLIVAARALADAARTETTLAQAVAAFDHAVFEGDADYLLQELPLAATHSREGCDRIAEIVRAMQGFARPSGTQKQLIDLNAAVRDTITVCRNEWKYVATMITEFDATMPLIPGLIGELQQVVLNLVINAARAVADAHGSSGELGTITVSTRCDGEWAEIRVQDDGTGIPESIRARVFDPFFTTKDFGSGTGQGLSIAHTTIVREHQGTLTFDTTEGHGTTFLIRLPLDGGLPIAEAA